MNTNTAVNEEHNETKKTSDIEEVSVELKKNDEIAEAQEEIAEEKEKEKEEEEVIKKPEISPGTVLRKAREENNLSIAHVADRLCLDIRVIEGLENDNYEKLPSTIFIRGYLRSYAKLLEIPEKSIIENFDRIHKPQEPKTVTPTPKIKPQKQVTSLDLWPKLVSILLIITVIVLMVIWQFYPNTTKETENLVTQVNPTTTESWTNENVVSATTNENNINNGTNNAIANQVESQTSTQVGIATETITESQTNIETTEPTPPVEVDHTLTVHFKRRVWMRINDSKGKQLYEGIGDKNQVLAFKGTPPYKIKVGNNRVDIEYLGETKNIRQFSRDDGTYIIGKTEEE
jgi:cytoskeleton protein RodZ